MKDSEITTPESLNIALTAGAISKRDKLWKQAEGRPLRWPEIAIPILASIAFLAGYGAWMVGEDAGIWGALAALFGLSGFMANQVQRQISALRELVKSLEKANS